jgi:hypothetical protein
MFGARIRFYLLDYSTQSKDRSVQSCACAQSNQSYARNNSLGSLCYKCSVHVYICIL